MKQIFPLKYPVIIGPSLKYHTPLIPNIKPEG